MLYNVSVLMYNAFKCTAVKYTAVKCTANKYIKVSTLQYNTIVEQFREVGQVFSCSRQSDNMYNSFKYTALKCNAVNQSSALQKSAST